MKVIVLGSGKIGSVIAEDFSESTDGTHMFIADKIGDRAEAVASKIKSAKWLSLDTTNYQNLVETLKEFDLMLGALPGDFGYKALEAAVDAGIDVVDVSFAPENSLNLDDAAKQTGVTIIPDCGVAPGLSNMLIGYSASMLDKMKEAHILVGGIPEEPVPPLGYTITWSAEGLIDEYIRDVSIVKDGSIIKVPALSGLEEIDFPDVGKLEAFYTDGLRTLIDSFPNVQSMWEKTMRYPGHVEKVKLLRELGFFDDDVISVGDAQVSPRLLTARLLEKSLRKPNIGDLLAMMVRVKGEAKSEIKEYSYYILDYFDRKKGVTAMARTTAYTASIVASMFVKGEIKKKGVIPLEKLGQKNEIAEKILYELKARNVNVNMSTS